MDREMTSMRTWFERGDHRFFKIYQKTGEKACCVNIIPTTARGKLEGLFKCDHLSKALYLEEFEKACRKCIKEMQEILENQPKTTRISVEHQSAKV